MERGNKNRLNLTFMYVYWKPVYKYNNINITFACRSIKSSSEEQLNYLHRKMCRVEVVRTGL
jgi:hypothetical protein